MPVSVILYFILFATIPFDCATALSHRHDRLRDVELVITSWSGCAVNGTINGVSVALFMDVPNCVLRTKVPGAVRVRYDQTCGAIVEMTDGPVITTPMPAMCPTPTPAPLPTPTPAPTPTPVPIIPSPDGTKATTIIDAQSARWTLGSEKQTLRNGIHVGAGAGSIYKFVAGGVYVLGMDSNWYRWSGAWLQVGPEPGVSVPIPTPISTPTPRPSPVTSPLPSPSPTPKPQSKCKWWQPWKCL